MEGVIQVYFWQTAVFTIEKALYTTIVLLVQNCNRGLLSGAEKL